MNVPPILVVLACAAVSTVADTMATVYWEHRRPADLAVTLVLAPVVFVLFGYVGASRGLATASGYTNSLIVAGPILVGLFARREAQHASTPQMIGLALIFVGVGLVAAFRPST